MLKKIIKKIVGKHIISLYHLTLAKLAAFYFRYPSEKIIVIGVTGTNGKTATVNFISQYLDCLGEKNGLASTVNFKIDNKVWLNNQKMTMLGRFQTQKLLSQMVKAGCKYAVIETSSQGIEQYRHIGINYDLVVFTNLTPEHIEAHGSFEKYRACKEKLFYHLATSKVKTINNKIIKKIIVSNQDDEETKRLRSSQPDKFVTYSIYQESDYKAQDIDIIEGVSFSIHGHKIQTKLLGKFNVYNILASLASLVEFGYDLDKLSSCKIKGIPGRQEWLEQGQSFKFLVDYAPEPESLKQLYQALENISYKRLIHILGSCGGGRDKARQPILGNMSGNKADIVIITNEDPYDDDPMDIIDNVATGAIEAGKQENKNLYKIEDREEAIKKAIDMAEADDLILITGKGAEQYICVADGEKIPWDDREIAKKYLKY